MIKSRQSPFLFHSAEDRCLISGTELRRMLSRGEMPPPEFSCPEVLEILRDYYEKFRDNNEKVNE